MKIESERFILRTLCDTDIEDFLSYRSDDNVARYQYWEPYTMEQAARYINKYKDSKPGVPGEWFQLGIADKASGRLIGDCAVFLSISDPGAAEVGCNISPLFQKNKVASEALTCLLDYAFDNLNVIRASAVTDAENIPCIKLLERLGMKKKEDSLRELWFKGKLGREYTYTVAKEEWTVFRQRRG
jgi:RimJ/RimL family protein N-acetyltransferase